MLFHAAAAVFAHQGVAVKDLIWISSPAGCLQGFHIQQHMKPSLQLNTTEGRRFTRNTIISSTSTSLHPSSPAPATSGWRYHHYDGDTSWFFNTCRPPTGPSISRQHPPLNKPGQMIHSVTRPRGMITTTSPPPPKPPHRHSHQLCGRFQVASEHRLTWAWGGCWRLEGSQIFNSC